jgi:hypothetical protein
MNCILALHEILHETKRNGDKEMILKLDFEKTYDKVNWDFLIKCVRVRGFSNTWCEWIKHISMNGTIAVKVNDCLRPYFQSHKGVR